MAKRVNAVFEYAGRRIVSSSMEEDFSVTYGDKLCPVLHGHV